MDDSNSLSSDNGRNGRNDGGDSASASGSGGLGMESGSGEDFSAKVTSRRARKGKQAAASAGSALSALSSANRGKRRRRRTRANVEQPISAATAASAATVSGVSAAYKNHPNLDKRHTSLKKWQSACEVTLDAYAASLNTIKETAYQVLGGILDVSPEDSTKVYFAAKIGGAETKASIAARLKAAAKAAEKPKATKAKKGNKALRYATAWYASKNKDGVVDPDSLNETIVIGNHVMNAVALAAQFIADNDTIVEAVTRIMAEDLIDDIFSTTQERMISTRKMVFGDGLVNEDGLSELASSENPLERALYLARLAAAATHLNHSAGKHIIEVILTMCASPKFRPAGIKYHSVLATALVVQTDILMGMRYALTKTAVQKLVEAFEDDTAVGTKYGLVKNLAKNKSKYPYAIALPTSVQPKKSFPKNQVVSNMLLALSTDDGDLQSIATEYRRVIIGGTDAPGMTPAMLSVITQIAGITMATLAQNGGESSGTGGLKSFCSYYFAPGVVDIVSVLLRYLKVDQISKDALRNNFADGDDYSLVSPSRYPSEQHTSAAMVVLHSLLLSDL